jgi:heme exporter protein B
MTVGSIGAALLILRRELRLSFRRPDQLLQPLIFFLIVTTLFPLALSPQLSQLRDIAPGALWVAALLSSLLAMDGLFRSDAEDGTLEQLGVPAAAFSTMILGLALGTLTLSWLGAIGAALTVSLRRGSVLLSLIVLPLAMPLLIFGANSTDRAIDGDSPVGPLYLLAALCVITTTLAPFAATAALRISLE